MVIGGPNPPLAQAWLPYLDIRQCIMQKDSQPCTPLNHRMRRVAFSHCNPAWGLRTLSVSWYQVCLAGKFIGLTPIFIITISIKENLGADRREQDFSYLLRSARSAAWRTNTSNTYRCALVLGYISTEYMALFMFRILILKRCRITISGSWPCHKKSRQPKNEAVPR